LVFDRAGADEDLPVRLAGDPGERSGQRHYGRALDGKDAEQFGETEVIADRQAERLAVAELRDDDLVARILRRGLLVLDFAAGPGPQRGPGSAQRRTGGSVPWSRVS